MFEFNFDIASYFILLSFGPDGLEVFMHENQERIVSRRSDNKYEKMENGPFNSKNIKTFLDKNESKCYDSVNYNSQDFATQLFQAVKAK